MNDRSSNPNDCRGAIALVSLRSAVLCCARIQVQCQNKLCHSNQRSKRTHVTHRSARYIKIHQVNIMNCVTRLFNRRKTRLGITASPMSRRKKGHWRTQNAQPGASYGVQTENDHVKYCQILIGIFRPQLIWGWVKTLVPSEPQNSW